MGVGGASAGASFGTRGGAGRATISTGATSSGGTSATAFGGTNHGGTTPSAVGVSYVGGYGGSTSDSTAGGYSYGGGSTRTANQAPVISSIGVSHTLLRTNDNLWVYPQAADPEGDMVYFSYAWTCNGEPVGPNASQLSGATYFSKGDVIGVTVTPRDSELSGASVTRSPILVENSPPVFDDFPTVIPSYTSDDATPLECTSTASDPDEDAIAVTYKWYLNDVVTTYADKILPAAATSIGDRWYCEVTVTDGAQRQLHSPIDDN